MGRKSIVLDKADCDYIRKTYAYDPETGVVTFKTKEGLKAGKVTGNTVERGGYRVMCVNLPSKKRLLKTHLVGWLIHHRVWPDHEVDHDDGDKTNCRLVNLKRATGGQNRANIKKYVSYGGKSTSSRFKGVSWNKRKKQWQAYIRVNKRLIRLGWFDLENEVKAAEAYNEAAVEHYGSFALLNEFANAVTPTPSGQDGVCPLSTVT